MLDVVFCCSYFQYGKFFGRYFDGSTSGLYRMFSAFERLILPNFLILILLEDSSKLLQQQDTFSEQHNSHQTIFVLP